MRVELPFLAEGIEGGDVILVLVHEGDEVGEGQSLIELETDKATIPVPAPVAGRVARLLVREGDHVKVGEALVELDETQGVTQGARASAPTLPASPSVRRLARELGVDLTQVKGTEAGGRITAEDVKAFVRERTRCSGGATAAEASESSNIFATMYGNERREPLPSLRRKIAANMTQAWTTIPHVHQFQDADITDLMELHKRYALKFKKRGATLTLTSLIIKAVVHALKRYPQLNATLDLTGGEVVYKDYYNIGVAVDTPGGLIVPVVHDVDHKDLFQISVELADLAERTRSREVKLEELRGATFTVSNMGGLGAGPFTPIINPPQVGILGIGKARMTPAYRDGQFVPRRILQLCVAYDHRLVDGAIGARFTNEIAKVLEDFQGTFLGL